MLIVKPSSLGDIVHTLPAVHLLKQRWPDAKFEWLVNPEFAALLEGNPDLSGTLSFPRAEFRGWKGKRRLWQWLQELRWRPAPDVALDFQGLLRSGLVCRFSGAKLIAGMTDSREGARFFHHHRVPVNTAGHAVDRYLALARAFGAEGPPVFPLPEGDCPEILTRAPLPRDFILLHPFSRGEGKSFSPAQVRTFCEAMAPACIMVVGRFADPIDLPPNALNLVNETTLPELMWLIRRARFTVSVDSGPMHIAAALTPNVLGLHTWSDPRKVGPWRRDAWVWKGGHFMSCGNLDPMVCTTDHAITDSTVRQTAEFLWDRLGKL